MEEIATTVGEVREVAARVLQAAGMPAEFAARTAWALAMAEAWGRGSHGVLRLPHYLSRFEQGGTNPRARLRLVSSVGAVTVLDGENGLGHWQAWEGARQATATAGRLGAGLVAIRDSGHCGVLGLYVLPMLDARMVGLAFSNGPAAIPPWGGHAPVLSTGPIAGGFPGSPSPAIVDLSTSAISRGAIVQAAAAGRPLPDGVAFDREGHPTTDARAALDGMLAPMGGAKGFSLGFLVEAITGALVGTRLSTDIADPLSPKVAGSSQRVAHLLLAIDPMRISPDGSSYERWTRLQSEVRSAGGRPPGSERPLDPPDSHPLTIARSVAGAVAEAAGKLGVALAASWTASCA